MRKLAQRGSLNLYETSGEGIYWLETKLNLDNTTISEQAESGLEKNGDIRTIMFLHESLDCLDAEYHSQLIDAIKPVLIKAWKENKLRSFSLFD